MPGRESGLTHVVIVTAQHHDWGNAFNFVLDHHGILTWAMYIAGMCKWGMAVRCVV